MPSCSVSSTKSPWVPDVGIGLEVGGAIARAVRVVPEADAACRGRASGADQLALLAAHRLALVVVEDLDRHAEAAALDLAAPDRADRVAPHEAGDDVGAAGDRGEADVLLDVRVDIVEASGTSGEPVEVTRRTGGEVVVDFGIDSRPLQGVDVLGGGAEQRACLLGLGEVEQDVAVGDRRASRRRAAASPRWPGRETSQFHIIQPQVVK